VSALLEAQRIHARPPAGERDVLRDVSLSVRAGEIVALLGPNGSGKSTLLAVLGGEIAPRQGRVLLDGADVRRMSRRSFARRVARLPQEPACPEGLTVAALVASGRHPHRGLFAPLGAQDRAAIASALSAMGLSDLAHRPVERLSGGERRRVWLAMVLAQEAELLLLDEPTAALDLRHQWEVLELLARTSRERGVGVVAALHDLEQAAALAQRVAVMQRGRVYELGPPERCLREEMIRDVYQVDARVSKQDGALRVRVRGPADPIRSL
jgi:iron complex transport system ATP-binding protein